MTPQAAGDAAGISRQAIMKQIREGEFTAGGVRFIARREGSRWDVILATANTVQQSSGGNNANINGGGRRVGYSGSAPPLEALKAKRLWTQIQLDEQKIEENNRQLRRRFAECVNNAIMSAGADFAGKARALRLPPDVVDDVSNLGVSLKNEFKQRFIEELEEWEKTTQV